jgi:hypothetical protein
MVASLKLKTMGYRITTWKKISFLMKSELFWMTSKILFYRWIVGLPKHDFDLTYNDKNGFLVQ